MNKIKLVIIDLDDTIYSEYDFVQSGFRHVAEKISKDVKCSIPLLIQNMNVFFNNDKKTVFNQLLSFLKPRGNFSLEKFIELYKSHIPNIKPYDDFYDFCAYLDKTKIDLVLLTDGDIIQQKNKVLGLGIENFFKKIYYSDSYGIDYRKPNPKIYLEIMKNHKLKENEILVIGDNPHKDFFCKKSLGIKSIQIIRPNAIYANSKLYLDDVKPERIIESLTQVKLI